MAGSAGTLLARLRLDSKQFNKSMASTQRKVKTFGKDMRAVGSKMSTTLTMPMLLVGAAAAKVASDFDRSMTQIETLVGVSADQVNGWREELLKLAPTVGKGPKELAEALFFVTSAGARGAEAIDILTKSAQASAVGLGETKTVAHAIVSAVNAYGSENLSAAQAADVLTAAIREGNLEASSLGPVLGQVLGTAKFMGISFAEATAFIATFSRTGADAAMAATSLNSVMTTFLKTTPAMAKQLHDMGISVKEVRDAIKKDGLAVAMVDLIESFDGDLDALGKVIANTRALRGVLADAASQGEDYIQIAKNITNSNGILAGAFARTSDTVAQKFAVFMAKIEVLGVHLGNALLPVLLDLVDWVGAFADKMSAAEKNVWLWTAGGVAMLAIVGPLVLGIGALIVGFTALWPVIAFTALAIDGLVLSAVTFIGTIGLIPVLIGAAIVAIASLVAAVFDADDAWNEWVRGIPIVGEVLDKVLVGMKTTVHNMAAGILEGFDWLVAQLQKVAERVAVALDGAFGSGAWLNRINDVRAGTAEMIADLSKRGRRTSGRIE